jgi:hypothetical protein
MFLENQLTGCGEVVSLKSCPSYTPTKVSGTHFYCRLRIENADIGIHIKRLGEIEN